LHFRRQSLSFTFGITAIDSMKPRILIVSVLLIASAVGFGLRPPPVDQCRLSMKAVFQSEDEQLWHLKIETREPTRYQVMSSFAGGYGGFSGDTATVKSKRDGSEDGLWVVFSLVTPSGDGPAYLKTILKSRSRSLSQSRQVPRGTRLGEVVGAHLVGEPSVNALNIPVLLAELEGQRVRLMVGEKAEQMDAEQCERIEPN
jgi:hypothetical protein